MISIKTTIKKVQGIMHTEHRISIFYIPVCKILKKRLGELGAIKITVLFIPVLIIETTG